MINREDMLELTRRMTPSRHCFDRIAGAYMDGDLRDHAGLDDVVHVVQAHDHGPGIDRAHDHRTEQRAGQPLRAGQHPVLKHREHGPDDGEGDEGGDQHGAFVTFSPSISI